MSSKQDDKPRVITETRPPAPGPVVREDNSAKALWEQARAAEAAKPAPPRPAPAPAPAPAKK